MWISSFSHESNFLVTLLVTILIEAGVIICLLRYFFPDEIKTSRVVAAGFFPTFCTLPYVWFILPAFLGWSPLLYHLVSEVAVVVVETMLLRLILGITLRKAASLSLAANIASYGIGLIL